jgi:hypothetical protein
LRIIGRTPGNMDNQLIDKHIRTPKRIDSSRPFVLSPAGKYRRGGFDLAGEDGESKYKVFIRQHEDFQENFSIGLVYMDKEQGEIALFRCNGNHGETVTQPLSTNEYHFGYHSHRMTAECIQNGIKDPPHYKVEDYVDYHSALRYFCKEVNVTNADEFLAEARQLTLFE